MPSQGQVQHSQQQPHQMQTNYSQVKREAYNFVSQQKQAVNSQDKLRRNL